MIKKLAKHGNSLALIIDRPILELLRIDQDTPLEVTTDGRAIFLRPVKDETHRERVRQVAKRVMDTHEATLRKLAK